MSAASPSPTPIGDGGADHILRPRPVKPGSSSVLRMQLPNGILKLPESVGPHQASGISRYMTFLYLHRRAVADNRQWSIYPSTR